MGRIVPLPQSFAFNILFILSILVSRAFMRLVSRSAPRDHSNTGGSGGTRTHTPLIKNQVPSSSLATLPWEARRDSNPRLPDPQSGGLGRLPTDLTCGDGPGFLGMFVGAAVLVYRPLWLPLGYRAI